MNKIKITVLTVVCIILHSVSPLASSQYQSRFKHLDTKTSPAAVINSTPEFIIPVNGRLSSPFGRRNRYMHTGIDIAAAKNTIIRATSAGVVVFVGRLGQYGKIVAIKHSPQIITRYAHCSKTFVKVGDYVGQGAVIAHVGVTGRATGPHLHFEVKFNGKYVNPLDYINKRRLICRQNKISSNELVFVDSSKKGFQGGYNKF